MGTRSSLSAGSSIVAIGILFLPGLAAAQSAPPPGAGSQGPMLVERVKSGFLVEPEVKVTSFDHQTSELVGADAGWLADKTFFIGGGGYWMASNQSHDRQLAYGGLVLGLSTPVDSPFSFGVKTLLGGGRATVLQPVTIFDDSGPGDIRIQQTPGGRPTIVLPPPIVTNVRFREDFAVIEPQANIGFKMSKQVRLTVGAGYRWAGRRHDNVDGLSGASGSVGVQIGGGG
jgi:hypothetical protein